MIDSMFRPDEAVGRGRSFHIEGFLVPVDEFERTHLETAIRQNRPSEGLNLYENDYEEYDYETAPLDPPLELDGVKYYRFWWD